MKNYQYKLVLLFLFGLGLTGIQAQEIHQTIAATGGNASGTTGTVSYSVGQLVYATNIGTTGSVSQGVQQPYEISVVTAIEEAKGINLLVSAYPNPASDYLILSIDENVKSGQDLTLLSYQMYDIQGKLLQNQEITENRTTIDMGNLGPATYFVKVVQGNKEVKTFKIIKD